LHDIDKTTGDTEEDSTETTDRTGTGAFGVYAGNVSCSIVNVDNALGGLDGVSGNERCDDDDDDETC